MDVYTTIRDLPGSSMLLSTQPRPTPLRQAGTLPNISLKPRTALRTEPSRQPLTRASTIHTTFTPSPSIPPLDPSPHDPTAVFVRYPFKQSMKWKTFMDNPNWFLDPADFTGPDAHPYPPELEPPRGWGPPKPKRGQPSVEIDKEREENRLRCTFCRRTYGGVNAKSMWRRHVLDKHHVAMRNRRENGERPVGRTKENKRPSFAARKAGYTSSQAAKSRGAVEYSHENVLKQNNLNIQPEDNYNPVAIPLTPKISEAPLSSVPGLEDILSSSPYDPTRTPQFSHSRPIEPLSQALKYPSLSAEFYGPALSPIRLLSTNPIEDMARPSSPIPVTVSDTEHLSPSPDSEDIFPMEEGDESMISLDLSYEDFNNSFPSSQASTSLMFLSPTDLHGEEDFVGAYAEYFNLEMDSSHTPGTEYFSLQAC